ALLADGPLTQQDGAPLTAARLVASSRSDSVQLAAANGVGALAGRAAGAFRFRNATGDLRLAELTFTAMSGEVGTVRSQAGVQAGTTLALNAEGGNLTQDSSASLAAASLLATSSSGVLLDNPDNETGSLAGVAGQRFGYRDATGMVLGSVDGVSGVRGDQVSLRAGNGDLSQSAGADIAANSLLASSETGSVLLANATNETGSLAGVAKQRFSYRDATGVVLGSVDGVSGVRGDQVLLHAGNGDLSQSAGADIVAGSLLAISSSGVLLDNPDNETGSLAGVAKQRFSYRDATGIVLGNIDDVSGVRGDQVLLRAGNGDLSQNAGADIVAGSLLASSSSGVLLDNPGNDIGSLAGVAGQRFSYRDATGVVLGSVDGVSGVRGDQVLLRAGSGDLSQSAGTDIVAGSLLATSSSGVLLDNPDNETGSLAGVAGQRFSYRDATGVVLGSVDGVSGVHGDQVSLRAGSGDLSQNAGADIVADSLLATSETGSVLLANATNETGSLAGVAKQSFSYRDATGIVLDNIDDVNGVRASQMSLRAGNGDLSQNAGADILADSLLATSSSGVLLDNPDNETGSLAGLAKQSFSYRDATGIALGRIDDVSGVQGDQVSLRAGNGDLSQSAGADIATNNLLASSETGSVLLANSTNETGSLAGLAKQTFSYRDATGIVLDSADGVSGVRGDQVLLRAGNGDLSQSIGADIAANGLLASSETGSVWLTNPRNALHALAGRAAGTFVFTNADNLRIGSVDGVSGLQASQVLLVGNGDLDQELGADIVADRLLAVGTGSVRLENPGNEMSLLVGLAGPTFSYRDATGVVFGSVDGLLSGIQASQVLLRAGNGDLSQIVGADILADSLLAISETGSVRLENLTNAPYVLAGRAAGAFVFVNADALRIGTVDGVSGVVAGSVLVRNLLGDLTLDAPVAATAGSAVLATGGRLQNPGGQGVTASSFWQIWADTWIGETRGGLAGSGPTPNLYGCAYGGACVSAAALASSAADNHFLYRQQPSARIVFNSYALPLGTLPGPLFEVDGLVLDDAGNGIEVSPQSDGLRGGPPGVHVLTGSFTSTEGYVLTSVPGTLTYYLSPEVVQRPDWVRRRPDTWLYDHNLASASMCPAPGITTPSRVEEGDELSREWSLVKSRPRLGSCVPGDKRSGCADF
ncbi:beta strand repeat-containing protein, partial [Azotobacter beijerinckii]|uniref:beta strand repeat-containing protein n=1 Tax=Azotobacter beijerinckii TaxID=170623 RepID=UPI002953749D